MGYTRKWIPPTIPLRDNLAAWKALFLDVHQNLIDAGLVQTGTAGQLDISAVSALPADGVYAGFREYGFDDALQATAPVVIKLEFGCGREGLFFGTGSNARSRTPRIRTTVSISGHSASYQGAHPQGYEYPAGATSQLTNYGTSYLCYSPDRGFLGIVYGSGSRNKPFVRTGGDYYGATLALMVQRTVDAAGAPNGDGVAMLSPGITDTTGSVTTSHWTGGLLSPAVVQYVSASGDVGEARRDLALRLGGNSLAIVGGNIQTQQVFFQGPELKPFPWLLTYSPGEVVEGHEFEVEVYPASPSNFVALGVETSLAVDPLLGQRAGFAMLFE